MAINETEKKALEGYERIAFGSIADPVKLIFCEEAAPRSLRDMDLSLISEIKKIKGGGMEIKFYDRLQALNLMRETGAESSAGFIEALENGALRLEGQDEA